jgi:restriction endonuclease S subunit
MSYKKAFVVDSSEIERRLDPFYYKKEFIELENKIKKLNPLKLKDFIIKISSGATPNRKEEKKYYSNKQNGIPFLRVQNLSETGELNFINSKYINENTHNNYLKRSQVNEGDLLIKITGVGRMAVSCVAPKNFIGNINQHIVVIKTKNKKTSQFLATYLNTDIGEILAKRRATGGTRPALDYKALKNIPIINNNRIIQIMDNAYKIKKENESKAKELLASIDTYLLDKLDITLPKEEKVVSFKVDSSEIFGSRFDPNYYKTYYKELEHSLNNARYKVNKLGNLTKNIASGSTPKSGGTDYLLNGKNYFLRLVNLDDDLNVNTKKALFISDEIHNGMLKRSQLKKGDLLFGIAGSIGKMAIVDYEIKANINQAIALLRFDNYVNNIFIAFILNSAICKIQIKQLKRPVAQPNLNITELKSIKIPLPPLPIQNEIASHIQSLRDEAKELKKEAKDILKSAKDEVEAIILKGDIK